MRKGIKGQEMLENYIQLGACVKMIHRLSLLLDLKMSGAFNKSNSLAKKSHKFYKELIDLKSELEESMPFDEMTKLCKEKEIDPLDIFYNSTSTCGINKKQVQYIYDYFIKDILEIEDK